MRMSAWSSSNRNSASAFVSSVLPTPVGPRNIKEPMGRLGSCSPARARLTAVETALTASVWPITRLPSASSIFRSFSRSPSSIRSTGMPVQRDTICATCCSVTASSTIGPSPVFPSISLIFRSRVGMTPSASSPARARSPRRCTCSSSMRACSSSSCIFLTDPSLSFSPCQARVSVLAFSSRSPSSFSRRSSRSFEARSVSFFSASRSILS